MRDRLADHPRAVRPPCEDVGLDGASAMTDAWIVSVEESAMSAQGARVIDLEEYRRRREAQNERPTAATEQAPAMVWVPVWMWVPYWPMR